MALNTVGMLPDRVRKIRQLDDVLTAEDVVLSELEKVIDEIYERISFLHEELVNESWLNERLKDLTGHETEVVGNAEKLLVEVFFDINEHQEFDKGKVIGFLNKWLPAHLMYKLFMIGRYQLISGEKIEIRDIILSLKLKGLSGASDLKEVFLSLMMKNGLKQRVEIITEKDLWLLDGKFKFNGIKKLNAMKRKEVVG